MGAEARSHAGNTLSISTTVQNDDLNLAGFQGLTYAKVAGVGSVGEYGISTNTLTHDTWDTIVAQKAKGITNAGDPAVEVARTIGDPGQEALSVAGAPGNYDNYAFKITNQDGSVDYLRGLVTGPTRSGGRNEDFDLATYNLLLNQQVVTDNPSS